MTDFFVYDTLTGKRYNQLPVLDGGWTDTLNDDGEVWAKVSLRNPLVQRLDLANSGITGKASLAAVDGDVVPQAGPIWVHEIDRDKGYLWLRANGGLSIADHRVLLPVLAGRLPSDPTTDTRFMPQDLDPDSVYPWPTDTRTSRQGMIVQLLEQMMSWTDGDVPFVLPTEIPGTAQDAYRGSDLAPVGQRIRDITQLLNGVDVHFFPRWTSAHDGFEHVVRIGTTDDPLLFSLQEPTFYLGTKESSVTNVSVKVNGSRIGSQAFSAGGKAVDEDLVAVATNSTLTDAGFPLFDLVDQQRATVSEEQTLQDYADELVLRGQAPTQTWSFTHDLSVTPGLSAFNVGDFAKVRVLDDPYFQAGEYRMRIMSRSGDARGRKVRLTFQASGEFTPLGAL